MVAHITCMYLSCLTEVGFPLEYYTLELQDHRVAYNASLSGKVALLDEKTALVTAVQLGQANLIFVHKSILLFTFELPTCFSLRKQFGIEDLLQIIENELVVLRKGMARCAPPSPSSPLFHPSARDMPLCPAFHRAPM